MPLSDLFCDPDPDDQPDDLHDNQQDTHSQASSVQTRPLTSSFRSKFIRFGIQSSTLRQMSQAIEKQNDPRENLVRVVFGPWASQVTASGTTKSQNIFLEFCKLFVFFDCVDPYQKYIGCRQ